MPATMALVKTYWDGEGRQRAVSMWSIGSWGGSGFAALFGGFMASSFNWRSIFIASIVISVVSTVLIWGTPESRAEGAAHARFDVVGFILFMISVLALMIVLIFGRQMGWTSPLALGLAAVAVVGLTIFVLYERTRTSPFVDFSLFRNAIFTGATISNFVLNGTIGMLIVSQQMLQIARPELFDPWRAGLLTIGYAVAIIAFIRVGEKLLRKFGPRKPMIWAAMLVALSCVLLMPTNILVGPYTILAVIAYTLFGVGLAFYATPSTDAALSNLPPAEAGAGAGIYKMASSLGGAIGAAISLTLFSALLGTTTLLLGNTVVFTGIQTNVDLRQAGMVVMLFNLLLVLGAILSIVMTVPKGGGSRDLDTTAAQPGPTPQLPLDDERQAILNRLGALPTADLLEIEKQLVVNELAKLDPGVLQELVAQRRR